MISTTFGKLAILRNPSPGQIGTGTLSRLANTGEGTSFPHRVQISRLLRPVIGVVEDYEKAFLDLVKLHADRVADGNFKIRDDKKEAFDAELKALHELAVEVHALPLPQAVLAKSALTSHDLLVLEDAGLVKLDPTELA